MFPEDGSVVLPRWDVVDADVVAPGSGLNGTRRVPSSARGPVHREKDEIMNQHQWLTFGIAIGAGAGTVVGILVGNIALGIAFGVGAGVALGSAFDYAQHRR
jgi:hypothetical protein